MFYWTQNCLMIGPPIYSTVGLLALRCGSVMWDTSSVRCWFIWKSCFAENIRQSCGRRHKYGGADGLRFPFSLIILHILASIANNQINVSVLFDASSERTGKLLGTAGLEAGRPMSTLRQVMIQKTLSWDYDAIDWFEDTSHFNSAHYIITDSEGMRPMIDWRKIVYCWPIKAMSSRRW